MPAGCELRPRKKPWSASASGSTTRSNPPSSGSLILPRSFTARQISAGDTLLPAEEPDSKNATKSRNGFDLVLGNPPYIRIQSLTKSDPELATYYKRRYSRRPKETTIFTFACGAGLELLHCNGQLASSNLTSFFNAQYGEPLRALLARGNTHATSFILATNRYSSEQPNYVCLLFLLRAAPLQCRFVQADNLQEWLATLQAPERFLGAPEFKSSEWNFAVGHGAALFERLAAVPTNT